MNKQQPNVFIRMEKAFLEQLDYTAARLTAFFYELTAERRERKSTVYGTVTGKGK